MSFEIFKELYGDFPDPAVVPVGDLQWNPDVQGQALSCGCASSVSSAARRSELAQAHLGAWHLYKRQELEKLGFNRSPQLSHWTDTLFPSLQTFRDMYGHWRIPLDF